LIWILKTSREISSGFVFYIADLISRKDAKPQSLALIFLRASASLRDYFTEIQKKIIKLLEVNGCPIQVLNCPFDLFLTLRFKGYNINLFKIKTLFNS